MAIEKEISYPKMNVYLQKCIGRIWVFTARKRSLGQGNIFSLGQGNIFSLGQGNIFSLGQGNIFSLGQGNIFRSVCQELCSCGGWVSQHALQVVSQHALQVSRGDGIPACLAGGIPACLAWGGLQAHTQGGGAEGSGQGGL